MTESNLIIVNYLGVTLDLKNDIFRPCHEPDDKIQYIYLESNHLPNITNHVPASIANPLSTLSRNM